MAAASCVADVASRAALSAPSVSGSSQAARPNGEPTRVAMLNSALWGMKLATTTLPTKPQHARPVPATSSAMASSYIEDEEEESEEDITAAYEALYGKAFEGLKKGPSNDDNLGDGEDEGRRRGRGGDRGGRKGAGDSMEERVVQIRRVTKVVKGGKQLSFRAVVVIGDKKGTVGVGVGSAKEVITAVQKSATDARRHLVTVPMTKYLTFPHR